MDSLGFLLAAICVLALSGLPGCFFASRSATGQRLSVSLCVLGSGLGLAGLVLYLGRGNPAGIARDWALPLGRFSVGVDPLSAFFLALVFVVPPLGSLFGLGYWKHAEHSEGGRRLGLFYGLLAASMALVLISRDAVLFLVSWEVMAISAWFCATADEGNPEVRRAGWVYLVATHIGTLCLTAMFILWRQATGSFDLSPASSLPEGLAAAIFVLGLVGFGLKAGLMPLHVWLPGAHANAPSHVSAVMSGVMLKLGIYGIVRCCALLPVASGWMGWTLLAVGGFTALAAIALAIGQRDIKRFLAYSSVENIGVIAMGIGLAMLGRVESRGDLVALGMGAALFHCWNHGLFKPLLFLDAGAVIHATGTRNMDRLGGLGKVMPAAAAVFALGAVAISALPPLNGFASEFLLFVGLFGAAIPAGGGAAWSTGMAAGAVVLATVGALACAAFVRALGAIFLGSPRSGDGAHALDPGPVMLLPMLCLGAGCLGLGLAAPFLLPMVGAAVAAWMPQAALPDLTSLAPLSWVSPLGAALAGAAGVGFVIMSLRSRSARRGAVTEAAHDPAVGTWDCGYAAPDARMQYTGTSFGSPIVRQLGFALGSRRREAAIAGPFPAPSRFASSLPDPVLDRILRPLVRLARGAAGLIRFLQAGQTQLYVLYIVIITAILLAVGVGQP